MKTRPQLPCRRPRFRSASQVVPILVRTLMAVLLLAAGASRRAAGAGLVELNPGERVVLIGNSLAERSQFFGYFEALLHTRFPRHELYVRDLGWSTDGPKNTLRPSGFEEMPVHLKRHQADVIICFYGFNESFAGPAGVEKFKGSLSGQVSELLKPKEPFNGKGPPRVVLVSPIAFEDLADPLRADAAERNRDLKLYADATAEVGRKLGVPFVDLFTPTQKLFAGAAAAAKGPHLTLDGFRLTEAGYRSVDPVLDEALFGSASGSASGSANPARIGTPAFEALRAAVIEKNRVFFEDYRMVNGMYVYGGRKEPFGGNFPQEYTKLRQMAANRDRRVWDIAQGKAVAEAIDDSNTERLAPVKSTFGEKNYAEGKEAKYLTPEEQLKTFTLPPGYEISLVASEREFPDLANPDHLQFDAKGRLWVSCMPSYPQWKPGDPPPDDKLIVLEDTDGDGKADKETVFAGGLHVPTTFELGDGGAYVCAAPFVWFLKDTTGDGKADLRERVLHDFSSEDTHHAIHEMVWGPGGDLYFQESIGLATAAETAYGPVRNSGGACVYRYDTKSGRLEPWVKYGFANPWGHVFDRWGQDFISDGTPGSQHYATPISGKTERGHKTAEKFIMSTGFRPATGNEVISSRHFPLDVQGNYLVCNVIGFQGIGQFTLREQGSGFVGEKIAPLLSGSDRNFRPSDICFAPDGSLYVADWHNVLIGHMQYSQRDPNRDHSHGRIWRITYKANKLLEPAKIAGQPVPALLDLLKVYEDQTRYRVRRELRERDTKEVVAALRTWVAAQKADDPEHDHALLEALWVCEHHHVVHVELLKAVLRAKDYHARAAATRVLRDWRDKLPAALALLKAQANDEHPRVRLEAVVAASWFDTAEAAAVALDVMRKPLDYDLEYALGETMTWLEPKWKPLAAAGTFAADNPAGLEFAKRGAAAGAEAGRKPDYKSVLLKGDAKESDKRQALAGLAGLKGSADNGKKLFSLSCVACHKVGATGVDFAPDLSHIGSQLKREEIVQSIVDPNAVITPKFETLNVKTAEGDLISGLLGAETDDSLTIKIGSGQSQTIRKADIRSRATVKTSLMPEGLAATVSQQELVDLVEYLAAQK